MMFQKITEKDSNHNDLEKKSVRELIDGMYCEDQNALKAVGEVKDQTEKLIKKVVKQLKKWWPSFLYWCRNKWPFRST